MEITGKVWCFFEQSGTFKNEFKKLGYEAVDVDIQNNFGETDYVVDLFGEIEAAYDGKPSIFDNIRGEDLIMAFFPCIYFCENNQLYFIGDHLALKRMDKKTRNDAIIERSKKRQRMYELVIKMFTVADVRNLRMIVENPYATQHYLVGNFPYRASVIDKDRTRRGDVFRKPTQYWFVNAEPTNGFTWQQDKEVKLIQKARTGKEAGICSEERSMIHPDYARNFICDFILGKVQTFTQPTLF